jgi:hypothetical protein
MKKKFLKWIFCLRKWLISVAKANSPYNQSKTFREGTLQHAEPRLKTFAKPLKRAKVPG